MSTAAVATFIAQLRKAQILDEPQWAEVDRLGKTATRPAEVAADLVKRIWLTPYQANQVARGRGEELVLGSYIVLEPLASGGMGQVVKARHRHMHRLVALKFIRPDQRASADIVQRFQREVRLLAGLRHPHIVQAYDAGCFGDIWFLAMELLDGTDLERLVRKQGSLPIGQACSYIRQAALGLHYAHERGLVHRDIKPSNLLLTSEGIKILDLGLARPQAVGGEQGPGDLTRANTVMGTPDYLAPEQALDPRGADARSDLYALGCTLFTLLTGVPPFPEGTLTQKLLYHQTVEPPAVSALRRDAPPALVELIQRLLAKASAQRPANGAEVAAALAPLANEALAPAPVPVAAAVGALVGAPAGGSGVGAPSLGTLWAVPAESMPPTPAPSLVDTKADAPVRGFTLMMESLPPTPVPTAVAASPATAAPHGNNTASPAGSVLQAQPASAVQSLAPASALPGQLTDPSIAAFAPVPVRAESHSTVVTPASPLAGVARLWSGLQGWQRGAVLAGLLLILSIAGMLVIAGSALMRSDRPVAAAVDTQKKAAPPEEPKTKLPKTKEPEPKEQPKNIEPGDPYIVKLPIPKYDITCNLAIWRANFVIQKMTHDRENNKVHFVLKAKRDFKFTDDGFESIKFYDEDGVDMIKGKNVVFSPDPRKNLKDGEMTRASLEIPAPEILKRAKNAAAVFSGFFAK